MEISRITSLGTQNQSMGTKEICILVVKDDHTCRNLFKYMIQHPINSEVDHLETAIEALNKIEERRDRLELVLTNVHRTDTYRFGVIQHIEKEFKLPVVLMNPDDGTEIKSHGEGATVCFLKSLSMEDINNIWEAALAREKGKFVAFKGAGSVRRELMHENKESGEETRVYRKRKKKENKVKSEESESSRDDSTVEKKARVHWTNQMHEEFLKAIEQLGHERAFPKKIVEVMNIPGLTRENVASHLQKYRMLQKKNPKQIMDSYYGMPSTHPALAFNSSNGIYQKHHWRSSHTSLISSEASTSMPKFVLSNSSFRFYGDQNKDILLSIENSHRSSNSDTSGSFMGFRLSNDKKSIECGQTRVLSIDETAKEMEFPLLEDFGNQNSVLYALTNGNCDSLHQQPSFPPLQSFLSTFETSGNQNSDQCPSSTPLLGTDGNENSIQHPFGLPILETHGNENFDECPPNLPILGTDQNENSGQFLSGLPTLGAGQEENSNQFSFYLPVLETDQNENSNHCPYGLPVSPIRVNSNSGQSPLPSNDSIPEQQSSMSFLRTCANVSSVQYPLTPVNCVSQEEASLPPLPPLPHEFDSFGPDGDLDVLLNTEGSTSAQAFWDGDFDDTLFFYAD